MTTCACCTASSTDMAPVSLATGQARWESCGHSLYALVCNGCTSALQNVNLPNQQTQRAITAINRHRAMRLPMLVLSFLTSEVLGPSECFDVKCVPSKTLPITTCIPTIMLYDVQILNKRRDTHVHCGRMLCMPNTFSSAYRTPGRHWQVFNRTEDAVPSRPLRSHRSLTYFRKTAVSHRQTQGRTSSLNSAGARANSTD